MFHQIEGMLVNETVNFAQLKSLIYIIIGDLFGEDLLKISVSLFFRLQNHQQK